ncbi:MAG: hypothetical protein ABI668_16070 [Sphingorhabdus sp.]
MHIKTIDFDWQGSFRSRIQRQFPRIEVSLVEDKRAYIEHMLVGGELDLALLIVSNLEQRNAIDHEVLLRSECRA